MTINSAMIFMGGSNFLKYLHISLYHAGVIHHFCQPLNSVIIIKRINGVIIQSCPGFIKGCCRHTGRQHKTYFHRQAFCSLYHIINTIRAKDIGNLMRIRDHRCGAMGQNSLDKLCRSHQTAFQMDMGVNEPRSHNFALHIKFLYTIIMPNSCNDTVFDCNIPM